MKSKLLLSAVLLSVVALTGCNDKNATPGGSASNGKSVVVTSETFAPNSLSLEQAFAKFEDASVGFTTGPAASKGKAYVFFDMQCPYCSNLFEATLPLANEVQVVWVPVSLMNRASRSQGATVLGADNPTALMAEQKNSVTRGRSGITTDSSLVKAYGEAVDKNTEFFNSFRGPNSGVPYIVTKVNGQVKFASGSMLTNDFKRFVGAE